MLLDLSQDYLTWDNTEQVSYQSTRFTGALVDTLATVKRRALTKRELAASGGAYSALDTVLLIPRAVLAVDCIPRPGDQWTDAQQTTYTVLEVQAGKRDGSGQYQTYRLVSRDPIIVFELQDLIDIQRAAVTYDAGGGKVRTWPEQGGGSVLYPQLAARVQLLTEEVQEERGLTGFAGTHAIFVATQIPGVSFEDRVKWVSGGQTYYLEVRGVRNPNRIDELPILDAELAP